MKRFSAIFLLVGFIACSVYAQQTSSKVLIVYYSHSGVTRGISERLQQKTGADVFELIPTEPYSKNIKEASDRATAERKSGNLPQLASGLPDISAYSLILVGGPVWSGTVASPVMTFLSQTDFAKKNVALFGTYDGSQRQYETDIRAQTKNAHILGYLGLSRVGSYTEQDLNRELDAWLKTVL